MSFVNNQDILTMEQAAETILRTAAILLDSPWPIHDHIESIMMDASSLRHKILELEKELR